MRKDLSELNIELLSPAGSVEAMKAAFIAGADAVYIGGSRFGARAYADNPDEGSLIDAIHLAHRLGKKLYMTVNTLMKEDELEKELLPWFDPYAEAGLDGVIVQDLGAIRLLHSTYPELPLHASTQMTVTGPDAARLLKEEGLVRVVPARELSLEEVRHIYDATGMEIESFAHGAMCYSYSGQCLMSSMIGGRSGNRGRCAGVCRLPFDVYENGRKLTKPGEHYPLNLKDMCTIDILPDMIRAGIRSFKIEGRMKKPEYTAGVTAVYRKYLDLASELLLERKEDQYQVSEADHKKLWDLFNRDGFSAGCYLEHNGRDLVAVHNEKLSDVRQKSAQELTEQIRKELNSRDSARKLQAGITGRLCLSVNGGASLTCFWKDPYGHTAEFTASEDCVQKAENAPLTEERIRRQIEKTGGSDFYFTSLDINMEEGIFVPMKSLNELRREAFRGLDMKIENIFTGLWGKEEPDPVSDATAENEYCDELVIWFACDTAEQFEAVRSLPGADHFYLPDKVLRIAEEDEKEDNVKYIYRLMLPFVMRDSDEKAVRKSVTDYAESYGNSEEAGILVRNLEEYGLLHRMGLTDLAIADHGLYTMNNRTEGFYCKYGVRGFTAPLELNSRELQKRDNHDSELVVYGRTPMMISTHCLKKTMDRCDHKFSRLTLRDRKGVNFPVQCRCDQCFNIIYNSLPTSLINDREEAAGLGFPAVRINFTVESGTEAGMIAEIFLEKYAGKSLRPGTRTFQMPETTRGHFHRGVE
ncbi:MAG: U32 family peptidase [Eubacteriales bacterium]|jgi:putative protease